MVRGIASIGLTTLLIGLTGPIAMAGATPAAAAEVGVAGSSLMVDGVPFIVRGAAGDGPLPLLAQLGANTVRSYGGDLGTTLDSAEKSGLKVIAGVWLAPPRLGADYADRAFVDRQLAAIAALVRRFRDHPALLMWGVGNEVEAGLADPTAIWPAIEEAAALIRSIDPDHPAMAVLAEAGEDKVRTLRERAPHIAVLGINSYGDALFSLPARVRGQGWNGPVVITEMGALGQWQVAHTPWGAPFEPTSTQKAIRLRRYLDALDGSDIGTVAFLWGAKQEVTPTWHSLLIAGEWTEAVEAFAESWGGRTPGGNHAPRIATLRFADDIYAPFASWPAGEGGAVTLDASDPDGDPLDITWTIMAESDAPGVDGDPEPVPPAFPQAVLSSGLTGARVGPLPPGRYRIFVALRDGRGGLATGNLPFEMR